MPRVEWIPFPVVTFTEVTKETVTTQLTPLVAVSTWMILKHSSDTGSSVVRACDTDVCHCHDVK